MEDELKRLNKKETWTCDDVAIIGEMMDYIKDVETVDAMKNYEPEDWQEEWWELIKALYKRIVAHDFPSAPIKFVPPITRVERYKMEKDLTDEESVFYTPIDGVDCNIDI